MNRLQKFCTPFIGCILQHLHQMCVQRTIENEETHRVESWGMGEIDTGVHPERTSQPNPRMYSTARSSPLHHDSLLLWVVNCYVFSLLAFLNGCFLPQFFSKWGKKDAGGKTQGACSVLADIPGKPSPDPSFPDHLLGLYFQQAT